MMGTNGEFTSQFPPGEREVEKFEHWEKVLKSKRDLLVKMQEVGKLLELSVVTTELQGEDSDYVSVSITREDGGELGNLTDFWRQVGER